MMSANGGAQMVKRYRKYTEEQKQKAVALMRGSEGSMAQMAKDLGMPPQTLAKWVRQAEVDAGHGPQEGP